MADLPPFVSPAKYVDAVQRLSAVTSAGAVSVEYASLPSTWAFSLPVALTIQRRFDAFKADRDCDAVDLLDVAVLAAGVFLALNRRLDALAIISDPAVDAALIPARQIADEQMARCKGCVSDETVDFAPAASTVASVERVRSRAVRE